MADSVYKVVELVGTSTESWEKAAKAAVERAGEVAARPARRRGRRAGPRDREGQGHSAYSHQGLNGVAFKYEARLRDGESGHLARPRRSLGSRMLCLRDQLSSPPSCSKTPRSTSRRRSATSTCSAPTGRWPMRRRATGSTSRRCRPAARTMARPRRSISAASPTRTRPGCSTMDGKGNRLDLVEFHPAYHAMMAKSIGYGIHAAAHDGSDRPAPLTDARRAALSRDPGRERPSLPDHHDPCLHRRAALRARAARRSGCPGSCRAPTTRGRCHGGRRPASPSAWA